MNKLIVFLFVLILALELFLGVLINYPPISGQIFFSLNVWYLRIFSLLFSSILLFVWAKDWHKIIIAISPIYFFLWYCYPLVLLELIVWVFVLTKIQKHKIYWWLVILLCILRIFVFGSEISVINKLNPDYLRSEVQERFTREDTLTERVEFPLTFRRMAYNKFSFGIKNILQESIPFFDLETLFFGEFHPLGLKTVVIFYWPLSFLFFVGLFYLGSNKKYLQKTKIFLIGAFLYFILSKGELFLRLSLLWITFSVPIYLGFKKINKYWKIFVFILIFYAFVAYGRDVYYRQSFWLDNKPLVHQYCFDSLRGKDDIYTTRVLGDNEKYCQYYYGQDCNLVELEKAKNVCLFAGEITGSNFKNDIGENWQEVWREKGYKIIDFIELSDSVAFGLSNYLVIGEKNAEN